MKNRDSSGHVSLYSRDASNRKPTDSSSASVFISSREPAATREKPDSRCTSAQTSSGDLSVAGEVETKVHRAVTHEPLRLKRPKTCRKCARFTPDRLTLKPSLPSPRWVARFMTWRAVHCGRRSHSEAHCRATL